MAATALAALVLQAAAAAALPVRIRSETAIAGQARFVQGGMLELRGQLLDDGGGPIADAPVELVAPALGQAVMLPCPGRRGAPGQPAARATVELRTGPDGGFCRRCYRVKTNQLAGGGFEPRPAVIDLDRERTMIGAVLSIEAAGEPGAYGSAGGAELGRGDLTLLLEDGSGRVLAQASTAGDGRVQLALSASALGEPGPGELRLRFAGSAELEAATDRQAVAKSAGVRLRLGAPVAPGDPRAGIHLTVLLETRHGQVAGGVVEASLAGRAIGAVPVHAGRGELLLTFDPGDADAVPLTVSYLPAAPWWRPASPLSLTVPVQGPSGARRILLGAAVLATAAWVMHGWRRARRPRRAEPPRAAAVATGISVVGGRGRAPRWDGRVIDAHEGTAVAGAEIQVCVPAVAGDGVLCRCRADGSGQFHLALQRRPDVAEIAVRAPGFSPARALLPAPGTLRVALVTRRRSVLARFVAWARRRGAPFDVEPEPTPAHVRRAAKDAAAIARWAGSVEQSAFGREEVDEAREEALRREEP
ncbi:MAG: hypothetical protein HY744_10155 [Deltaproteobacteria bacterium]|nr:hypothetical protein [Deltaproteobacteria bacterium]